MVNRHFNPKTYWDLIVSERQLWGFIVPYFTCSHSTGGERATERHCATVRRDADWNYSKQHAWKRKERKKKTNITDRWIFLAFSSLLWITLCYTVLLLYLLPVLSYLVCAISVPFDAATFLDMNLLFTAWENAQVAWEHMESGNCQKLTAVCEAWQS